MTERKAPTTSLEVRERLVEALQLDLVGPWPGHELSQEKLPTWMRPSNWYLAGFIVPSGMPPEAARDDDEDEDVEAVSENAGAVEESAEEQKAAKKGYFPSSIGLSFLVPRGARALSVTVRWADYVRAETEDDTGKKDTVWKRIPREEMVSVGLATGGAGESTIGVPQSRGLEIHVVEREVSMPELASQIPNGTRSVSVFLVNRRQPVEDERDECFAFQAQLHVTCDQPFVPRPDLRQITDGDWDERVADLHFADAPEFATGHGISATWEMLDGSCNAVRTEWIPTAEVEKTVTVPIPNVELSMSALGALPDGAAARNALQPLVDEYRDWIERKRGELPALPEARRETGEGLLHFAGIAADRMEQGISTLETSSDALDAFRIANRAVSRALQQRNGDIGDPAWRAFQLAFILLNLPGLVDPKDRHRETVDLLFFPTGGGKTEAYLGLAAFAMVFRRLQHPDPSGVAGAGVSVIMRYTLRLLTLDQLGRAAGLVCALELEREGSPERYGSWPFEIGLWVGKAATPNELGKKGDNNSNSARAKVRQFKANPQSRTAPIPIENCPWCGTEFHPDSFALLPNDDNPTELQIVCTNFECDFSGDRSLPIVAVDDGIYRRLPAFLIATLDKFATLPWVGKSGVLLGGADRHDKLGFYGAAEPKRGTRLPAPLSPPDFIIQDELHLISGPLGTVAGLYETAIESLCLREDDGGKTIRPKIVASTATARRAQDQVQALFGRPLTLVFPPPGLDRRDSFFAEMVDASKIPARLYLGIAAQGKNPKVVLRRAWLALMGAAEQAYRDAGGQKNHDNPADPYMTVLGYFNSLRELGGSRRILEEEVQNTVKGYGGRRRVGETRGLFNDRKTFSEVVELTSRVPTAGIAIARQRLELPFHEPGRVDCAIATNMISVGLDIQRLGLMVVLGQPKTHSEYIQATSRVGRDDTRPGLVVTLLNVHKPRDRSHYERFRHYHETFYRSVEVTSVTPFSARALDRAFAGALVALARHRDPILTPPQGAEQIVRERAKIEQDMLKAFLERVRQQPFSDEAEKNERLRSVQSRIVDLLDSWRMIAEDYQSVGAHLQYQKYESSNGRPLLREMLDEEFETEHHRKFRANRSLRDVEPEVNLFLRELSGSFVGDEE